MPTTVVTESIEEAAEFLRRGSLVAFPTETVYGLGADAFDESAVGRIFEAKGRPADNPIIVHLLDSSWVRAVASGVPRLATLLLDAFAPGPISVLVPRSQSLPAAVTAGLDSVAVRIPAHPTARKLLSEFGKPIAAPSANKSGRPSPTTWQDVKRELGGRIDCLLAGPPSTVGLESTVVDCRGSLPLILRHGFVTAEQIADVVGVEVLQVFGADRSADVGPARSPGTRHPHYAPSARIVLVDGARPPGRESAPLLGYIGLDGPVGPELYHRIRICRDASEYASELYAFFRACEDDGIEEIHCARVPAVGVGRAVMDRLERAAAASR